MSTIFTALDTDRLFFVYARSGSKDPVYLAGPWTTKGAADPFVDLARALAEKRDSWAVHYEFGVCGVPAEQAKTIKPLFAIVLHLPSKDDPKRSACGWPERDTRPERLKAVERGEVEARHIHVIRSEVSDIDPGNCVACTSVLELL